MGISKTAESPTPISALAQRIRPRPKLPHQPCPSQVFVNQVQPLPRGHEEHIVVSLPMCISEDSCAAFAPGFVISNAFCGTVMTAGGVGSLLIRSSSIWRMLELAPRCFCDGFHHQYKYEYNISKILCPEGMPRFACLTRTREATSREVPGDF